MSHLSIGEFVGRINTLNLYPKQGEILTSFYNNDYKELVAILGRRSGKKLLSAVIALYEAYCCSQSDNHDDTVQYIVVLSSNKQQSNYLREYILNFISDLSLDINIDIKDDNFIYLGHNHKTCIEFLYGDVFSIADRLSGKDLYSVIFCNYCTVSHCRSVYLLVRSVQQHIITITSLSCNNKLFFNWLMSPSDNKLVFKYATWDIVPDLSREDLESSYTLESEYINSNNERKEVVNNKVNRLINLLNEEQFFCEYGSEFINKSDINKTISIRIPESHIETLKHIARLRSIEQGDDITYSDLIRECIEYYIRRVNGLLSLSQSNRQDEVLSRY